MLLARLLAKMVDLLIPLVLLFATDLSDTNPGSFFTATIRSSVKVGIFVTGCVCDLKSAAGVESSEIICSHFLAKVGRFLLAGKCFTLVDSLETNIFS